MKKELKNLALDTLKLSPWNPRTADELKDDNPDMMKLVASVKATGIHQSLAVWDRGAAADKADGVMLVIAGHRRYMAAKAAGLADVPAIVYTDITEREAREITRIENEVRLGISPQEDARLLSSMVAAGWRQNELAARFGVSPATICRRMKLTEMSPKLVESLAAASARFTADALERLAAYGCEIQEKILPVIRPLLKGKDEIQWARVKPYIERESRDLDSASFDAATLCASCPKRTGAMADLFDDLDTGELGTCLDGKCFDQRVADARFEKVEEIAKGAPLVNGDEWDLPWWAARDKDDIFGEKRDKGHTHLWYWITHYDIRTFWGPAASEYARLVAEKAETERIEREAREEVNAKKRAAEAALGEFVDKFDFDTDEEYDELISRHLVPDGVPGRDLLVRLIRIGLQDWDFGGEDIAALCRAYPALAEEAGVTREMFEALDAAEAAEEK